jgi:hypothetical protein
MKYVIDVFSNCQLEPLRGQKCPGRLWVTIVSKDLSRQANTEITLPECCLKAGPAERITVNRAVASLHLPASNAILVQLF